MYRTLKEINTAETKAGWVTQLKLEKLKSNPLRNDKAEGSLIAAKIRNVKLDPVAFENESSRTNDT